MEEADLKKQYDDLLAIYSRKRSQIENMDRQLPILNNQIDQLRNKIKSYVPPQTVTNDLLTQEQEKQDLIKQYEELISFLNRVELQCSQLQDPQIASLKGQFLALEAASKSVETVDNSREMGEAVNKLGVVQNNIADQETKVNQLEDLVKKEENLLLNLQKEVAILKDNKSKQTKVVSSNPQIDNLQNELKKIETEEIALIEDIKKEETFKNQNKSKQQNEEKALRKELSQVKESNKKFQKTLSTLEDDLKKIEKSKSEGINEKQIKQLESQQKSILKELDHHTKEVAEKKEVLAKKKKEEKNKQKQKDKRNYKHDIIEEETLLELQHKELEREEAKLKNVSALKKTYAEPQSLNILQKQYERHQVKNKPNLQAQQAKKDKLVREKNIIKSRIDFLLKSSKEMEIDSEKKLRDLKVRGDELVKQKLAHEKVVSEATYKFNEYLKEFPNHQKNKEDARNQERKRKQEARDRAKQEQQQHEVVRRNSKKDNLIETVLDDSNEPAWEGYNADKIPPKDEKSIFNNKQFQLGTAILAVIAIVGLSFA